MSSSAARAVPACGERAEREDVAKELDALRSRLEAAAATNIGFPATSDFDYSALAPFFARYMLNNLGDPYSDGAYPMHTKPMEREVVDTVADLFGAPPADRWGYVAGGATEGTEYALHLASTLHSDAVVYHSTAAHHAITNVIQRLGLTSIPVRADALGEIDYDDLADQVNLRRNSSAIVIANIGTAVTEAVDDVARIAAVLDRCAVRRRWIHGDAALSGIPLALLDPDERPAIDFPAGIDSIVTSGHKFLGAPVPCAVVVVRNSHRLAHARAITYTGSPDTTVGNSRSGLAAMVLWYALRTHGLDGLRARAEQSRQLAAAAHEALREIGWPAHRHKHSMSVSFPTPPASVTQKWVLATHGATSLIVCMPGVTAEQVDAFVADLKAAITPAAAGLTVAGSAIPGPGLPDAAVPGFASSGPAANGSAANGSGSSGSGSSGSGSSRPASAGSAGTGSGSAGADPGFTSNGSVGGTVVPIQGGSPGRSSKAAQSRAAARRDPEPSAAASALDAVTPLPAPVLVPAAASASAVGHLWATDPIEESLAPMPSLSEDPMASVSPAPMPSLAGAALIAPAATVTAVADDALDDWPSGSADHAIGFADTAAAMSSVGTMSSMATDAKPAHDLPGDVRSDGFRSGDLHSGDLHFDDLRADAAADAVVVPLGPLLPTPPQSLQRQKMLRRAGMPIRL
jgi:histidine decarboxylase